MMNVRRFLANVKPSALGPGLSSSSAGSSSLRVNPVSSAAFHAQAGSRPYPTPGSALGTGEQFFYQFGRNEALTWEQYNRSPLALAQLELFRKNSGC